MHTHRTFTTWKPILPAVGSREQRHCYGIYSPEQFEKLISYEKNRSDRKGTTLSLVMFDVSAVPHRDLHDLIESIAPVVRATDHLGWFDRKTVAALLPYTTRSGAMVFLSHVAASAPGYTIPVRLYFYPEEWLGDGENGNGSGRRHADLVQGRVLDATEEQPPGRPERSAFALRPPVWKRVLDVTGASVGLVLLAPLLLVTAAFIKLVSPGPALFKQTRIGLGHREFTFYKFRTMHVHNDEGYHADHAKSFITGNQTMEKLDDRDPRIIPGGRVIRRACIDELPQLMNILRGDMSLVGPRPCIPYEAAEYLRWHGERFTILPGLTGLWQVSGKNHLTFAEMIRLDIAYEKRMSPWLDLWIILRTVPTVFGLVFESLSRRIAQKRAVVGTDGYTPMLQAHDSTTDKA